MGYDIVMSVAGYGSIVVLVSLGLWAVCQGNPIGFWVVVLAGPSVAAWFLHEVDETLLSARFARWRRTLVSAVLMGPVASSCLI
ncbi:MAG: hypothetical protein J0I18_19370 [Actinobacteria bacterium]|nr:hypothetical protein [Actinomycetota bacterium]